MSDDVVEEDHGSISPTFKQALHAEVSFHVPVFNRPHSHSLFLVLDIDGGGETIVSGEDGEEDGETDLAQPDGETPRTDSEIEAIDNNVFTKKGRAKSVSVSEEV